MQDGSGLPPELQPNFQVSVSQGVWKWPSPIQSCGARTRRPTALCTSAGDKSWQLSLGDDRFHMSRYSVAAGDTAAVASHILKAAARFKISGRSEVYSVYEAGRDGWWFHRWLCELGVGNIVVDPSSIEVSRRARQAKTDRLDADKLLAMLIRHHAGERVWSVLREPSREDEDARREHRELQRLSHERIAHTNRIG
jgi:transposase